MKDQHHDVKQKKILDGSSAHLFTWHKAVCQIWVTIITVITAITIVIVVAIVTVAPFITVVVIITSMIIMCLSHGIRPLLKLASSSDIIQNPCHSQGL